MSIPEQAALLIADFLEKDRIQHERLLKCIAELRAALDKLCSAAEGKAVDK